MDLIRLPHHHGTQDTSIQLQEPLSQLDNFYTVFEIFKPLGDTTRIRIFWLLFHCE